ncbi:MAG: RNA polymerase sigma factor [Thermoanaerobaculia bacterium]
MSSPAESVSGLVDHLFRRKSGEMVAALTRTFGPARLDLVEEVVQEAMIAALTTWPFHGVPENPGGWLFRAARNRALDRLRRERTAAAHAESERETDRSEAFAIRPAVEDDQLRLVFLCCAPEIPPEARVALTLKLVCGFSVDEIARALLAEPAAIAQRIVRAKRTIREQRIAMDVPAESRVLRERIDVVLDVLYLLFNEGHSASAGEDLVRVEVAEEAIRLATVLTSAPATDLPAARALRALMLFHAARFPARRGATGDVILLREQDRALWNRARIAEAFREFDRSLEGDRLTRFHVEAAIAAVHAEAASFDATDWPRLLGLYDQLLEIAPSPVVLLNRSVVLARLHGPAAAVEALQDLASDARLRRYPLLPALLADYWIELDERAKAEAYLERALEMPMSEPERRLLERKREACRHAR